jgi:hypothetical protein
MLDEVGGGLASDSGGGGANMAGGGKFVTWPLELAGLFASLPVWSELPGSLVDGLEKSEAGAARFG